MTDALGASVGAVAPSESVSSIESVDQSENAEASENGGDEEPSSVFRKHKHRVKIDEQDGEVDYDELVAGYQTRKAADKRFKAASEMLKRFKPQLDELDAFKKNPWEALRASGQDPYEVAEKLLLEKMEWEGLPDAERRARLAEMREQAVKAKLSEAEKAEKERRSQESEAKALQEIDDEIGNAIKATGRKATPRLIARITETLIAHHEAQLEELHRHFGDEIPDEAYTRIQRLPAADAVNRTHREYVTDVREYAQGLSVEELEHVLSRDQLDGLRKREVDKVLAQDPIGSRKPRQASPSSARAKPQEKRMSTDDFFKKLESKLG